MMIMMMVEVVDCNPVDVVVFAVSSQEPRAMSLTECPAGASARSFVDSIPDGLTQSTTRSSVCILQWTHQIQELDTDLTVLSLSPALRVLVRRTRQRLLIVSDRRSHRGAKRGARARSSDPTIQFVKSEAIEQDCENGRALGPCAQVEDRGMDDLWWMPARGFLICRARFWGGDLDLEG